MPKLNKKVAKAVDKAEAVHGFSLLTPGKYFAKLTEVKADTTKDGAPMWVAEFSDLRPVDGGDKVPGRQWWNLNLPQDDMPKSYDKGADKWEASQRMATGRLKAFFEAFGYEVDSDTDEMLGEVAVLTIGIRTIQQGARQGDKANTINDIESVDEFGGAPETDGDDEDAF